MSTKNPTVMKAKMFVQFSRMGKKFLVQNETFVRFYLKIYGEPYSLFTIFENVHSGELELNIFSVLPKGPTLQNPYG